MRPPVRTLSNVCLALVVLCGAAAFAQRAATPAATQTGAAADATAKIVAAAQAVVAALDDAGRAKIQFPFDAPQKTKWSNLPSPMFQRDGVRLADLSAPQRASVDILLSTALSRDGYRKVKEIMLADGVLGRGQGAGRAGPGSGQARGGPRFAEDEYFLAFLGTPSLTTPWMLQFGGHHLAINLTMAGREATMAPSLPAAQPAIYEFEGRTVRPLGNENDKAFALINALDEAQRKQAIIGIAGRRSRARRRSGRTNHSAGRHSRLGALGAQQTMLLDIVREWAGIMHDAFAEPRMAEIRTNLPQTYFAWSGPTTNGSAAYFRIQGPTLVIEYAPQGGVESHPHHLSRSDERLRCEVHEEIDRAVVGAGHDGRHGRRRPTYPRIDATSICRRRAWRSSRSAFEVDLDLTPGIALAERSSRTSIAIGTDRFRRMNNGPTRRR